MEVMKFFMFGPSSAPPAVTFRLLNEGDERRPRQNVMTEQKPLSSTCDSDLASLMPANKHYALDLSKNIQSDSVLGGR